MKIKKRDEGILKTRYVAPTIIFSILIQVAFLVKAI